MRPKDEYEQFVREPALQLIANVQPALLKVSGNYVASAKKVGGSLFRVMKDTRFEHAEGPYKPWIGLRFYHVRSKNVHAPGFYAHLQPGGSFVGGGVWRPDSKQLHTIRSFITDNPASWKNIRKTTALSHSMVGEALKKAPRGLPETLSSDPLIQNDLRWKDFIWEKSISDDELLNGSVLQSIIEKSFKDLSPAMDYLCAALDLDF